VKSKGECKYSKKFAYQKKSVMVRNSEIVTKNCLHTFSLSIFISDKEKLWLALFLNVHLTNTHAHSHTLMQNHGDCSGGHGGGGGGSVRTLW
jgi:hypothetical protein